MDAVTSEGKSRLGDTLGCILLGLGLIAAGCAGRCIYCQHQSAPAAAEQVSAPVVTPAPAPAAGQDGPKP